jgi:hypothetical protein
MKSKAVVWTMLVVLVLSFSILAQEKEKQSIELPQLSLEQKLDRSVKNTTGREVVGIAYAKSMGKTPEDYGKFMGERMASFWADIKGKGPVPFIQYWYRFLQTDRYSKMEILSVSKTSVQAKMTVYGVTHIRAFADLGVTVEEYASYLGKFSERLADYVGLEYKQILDRDWILFTVTEKK